jgi:hypothetical protein
VRRAGRIDGNQVEIVAALRKAGASVQHLHGVGHGCPDLLVGKNGVNLLIEVKDPSQKPSQRRLTADETFWHAAWRGQTCVVETAEEALSYLEMNCP